MTHAHIKHSIVTYILNGVTFLFAGIAYIEAVNLSIKIISLMIAVIVFVFTFRRHRIELKIKRKQLEQEDLKTYILMEQSKKISGNGAEEHPIKIE